MSRHHFTEFPPAGGDQPNDVRRERSNVNGRRIIVTPAPRAPWWRREVAYGRAPVTGPFLAPPRGERRLRAALVLCCVVIVVAQVAKWWTR